jgi:phosphatidylserine/phosphatidylglycerophosphate/cardiolipin synthase-like enzyme
MLNIRRTAVQLAFLCGALGLSGCESLESRLERIIAAEAHLAGRSEAPHRLAVLSTGQQSLLYRLDRIRAAQQSIRIQTFIFADCKTTRLIIHELVRAARRGVEVHILADSMFSEQSTIRCARAEAAHPKIRFRVFNPVTESVDPGFARSCWAMATDFRRVNHRMHNKVMVVDQRWGICGGRNYDDTYFDEDTSMAYRDRDIAVEGAIVAEMVQSFDQYWNNAAAIPVKELKDVKVALANLPPNERNWPFSFAHLEITDLAARMEGLLRRGEPRLSWHDVHAIAFWADAVGKPDVDDDTEGMAARLIGALGSARHRLLVQTPYLVLTDVAIKLVGMLDDKVTVTVHTNSLASTDAWPAYAHSIRQRHEVIKTLGLDVYELKPYPRHMQSIVPDYPALRTRARGKADPRPTGQPGDPILSLHAKSLVVDDRLAVIGSYNLDPRSATLNTEVLLAVWDRDVASLLARQIERDCRPENSWVVAPKQYPLGTRSVLKLLVEVNEIVKSVTTLDLWPLRSCSLFDIKPDAAAVSRFEGAFYESYVDVGQFPEVSSTKKEILVRLTRSLTGVFRAWM